MQGLHVSVIDHFRANLEHISQSRPDSGPGRFEPIPARKSFEPFKLFPDHSAAQGNYAK